MHSTSTLLFPGIENTCEDPNAPCAATEWSNWSPCSATCGEGVRERRRYYMKSESANTCNRDMAETDSCDAKIRDCSKAFMFMNMTGTFIYLYPSVKCVNLIGLNQIR